MDEFWAENLAAFSWVSPLIGAEISAPPFIGKGAKRFLQNDPSKSDYFGFLHACWHATIGGFVWVVFFVDDN